MRGFLSGRRKELPGLGMRAQSEWLSGIGTRIRKVMDRNCEAQKRPYSAKDLDAAQIQSARRLRPPDSCPVGPVAVQSNPQQRQQKWSGSLSHGKKTSTQFRITAREQGSSVSADGRLQSFHTNPCHYERDLMPAAEKDTAEKR